MNIKQAKQSIENAITAYLTKNEFNEYVIPQERQRPVFLMGPPGIGKTAIMEQIAAEKNIALVAYSMTHHTRQSALGLPCIVKKSFEGREYTATEYTMSEIIASVYSRMELTGKKEGILFLDEINCVSETLSPIMLEFLQYKKFGMYQLPQGWIVVTAGNPPEYNNSVHDYDVATWDRLKRIDVEPDYSVWKEYAYARGTHPAIISYLDLKKENFYQIETTADGKRFVTARGWCDLSDMMNLYEKSGIKVTEDLIRQYLQSPEIARDFAVCYDLFNKYKSDYQVNDILEGHFRDEIMDRAEKAKFDERLCLLGLLIHGASEAAESVIRKENTLNELRGCIKNILAGIRKNKSSADVLIHKEIKHELAMLEKLRAESASPSDRSSALHGSIQTLNALLKKTGKATDLSEDSIKDFYNSEVNQLKQEADHTSSIFSNIYTFSEAVFQDDQELLILTTELTINYYTALFISHYGCREYRNHSHQLMFYGRQNEILNEIKNLSLE